MVKKRYRWQDIKKSDRQGYGNFTAASEVKITRADGTVEIEPAYDSAHTIGIKTNTQRHRGEARPERGARRRRQLIARFASRCNDCGSQIHEGDPIGWNSVEKKAYCARCASNNTRTTRGK